MKYFVLYALVSLCFITDLFAQSTDKKHNQPQENSKVTREYDEQGNLIKFDSIYSYSWSGDSTLMKQFSPEDMSKMFGGALNFFSDSTFNNHSFFGDFDKIFADPFEQFDAKHDSLIMKQFGDQQFFQRFNNNDSISFGFRNFNDLFGSFFEDQNDSTVIKKPDDLAGKSQQRYMNDMMEMFQQQVQEMKKRQQQFFEQNKKQKEF